MKRIKLFEEYTYQTSLMDQYSKKVGWVMKSDDIELTSGDTDTREKYFNINAKNHLFLNYYTNLDAKKDAVIVPDDLPILWYGGKTNDDSTSQDFFERKEINIDNLYNRPNDRKLSASKLEFAKEFEGAAWIPKTVFSKEEAINGAVGFPVIAKVEDGHSGLGIGKFDTAEELESDNDDFDIFCQFIDFDREYRILFCKGKIVMINERIPNEEDNQSIRTKKADDKIKFVYVYQDLNKVPPSFKKKAFSIYKDIQKKLNLEVWALDVVVDKKGKLWVMETSAKTGLGSVKMCELYKAIYEDFYNEHLPDEFLETIYREYVVPGHQNYWPKYKTEISKSAWGMDYRIITNLEAKDGYRYFFNLD